MQQGRIRQPNHSQQTYCRTFSNCTRGSDPRRVWNSTECKCVLEVLPAGVSTKHEAEQPSHLNRNQTQTNRCNTLRDFPLHRFRKHIPWFRCSGKGKHLNLATRQNPADNPLTTNVLQDFRQLCQRFRSQHGLECRRMQMHSGGTSEKGIPERCNRTAHASEPRRNPKNPLQHIEKLSITRIQQAPLLVQMQR